MKPADLQIPKVQRKFPGQPEPARFNPPDMEFTGNNLTEFVDDIQAINKHYSAEQVNQMRACSKIVGKAVPDSSLGEPFGTAFGRYWYMVP